VPLLGVKRACKKMHDEDAANFFRRLDPGKVASSQSNAFSESNTDSMRWELPAIGMENY